MLNNSPFLEELIRFDAKELSVAKIIFYKFRTKWLLILSLPFTGIGLLLFFSMVTNLYLIKITCLIGMAFLLFLAMAYGKRKTLMILRRYILEYTLNVNDIWAQRALIIREIQNRRFIGFLSSYPEINAEKIRFVIETLRFENSKPQYQYQFFNVFSVLFSVVAGAFLAAVIAIPKLLTSWESVIIFFKPIIGFSVMFILFTWFFEAMLLKDIFKSSANKYGRLLKVLQDYYLSID